MTNEKRLIDANALSEAVSGIGKDMKRPRAVELACLCLIAEAPTVDAVELPKGKPGDYLEWDNGTGFKQIYHIHAVMICDDCMRYSLENFAPVVNHPGIVRILTLEEAEREWHEMCEKLRTEEAPNMTAERMDGDEKCE